MNPQTDIIFIYEKTTGKGTPYSTLSGLHKYYNEVSIGKLYRALTNGGRFENDSVIIWKAEIVRGKRNS